MAQSLRVLPLLCLLLPISVSAAPTELLVRLREALAPESLAGTFRSMGLPASHVEPVNLAEGVYKLAFRDADTAEIARMRLLLTGRAAHVEENHYYQPALKLRWRLSEIESVAAIPGVSPPPRDATPGVDPLAPSDWALADIRLPAADSLDREASPAPDANAGPVTVAVIDTGVDYNHEDLSGGMWRNPANPSEVGWDFAHQNATPYDVVQFDLEGCMRDPACRFGMGTERYLVNPGHGTHCAGHVGAVANNSLGIRGVGDGAARIMGLKFFYDAGEANAGQGDDAAAIRSIDYAIAKGARIISASWGGYQSRAEAEKSELKKALVRAQKAGILVVVAAGNEGINQDTAERPAYPAAFDLDNLIVVAAHDREGKLADFSNTGAKSVHLSAPGVKILSTTVGSSYSDVIGKYKDWQGKEATMDWDGTSMATPIVAGAAALVWSRHPRESYRQIRDRLLRSARKTPELAGKVSSGGALDVEAALR